MLEADRSLVRLKQFFEPPVQPDLSCGVDGRCLADTSTYRSVIQRYDNLKQERPAYVQKKKIGVAMDNIPLYAYFFTPDAYENTVVITAGLHGNEKMGVWALLFFLRTLVDEEATLPALDDLRANTRLVVVPVVNPTGFTDGTRQNRNGVDLNRNFDYR